MNELQDIQLVNACLSGDNKAFETLLNRYKNQIYSLLLRLLSSQPDAEDIAQETFIKAFCKLNQYNPDYPFITWLFKIAHNTALDFLRAKKPSALSIEDEDNPIEIRDSSAGPEETLENCQHRDMVERALALLPPLYQEILILRHRERMDYEQLAQVLGLSLGAAKTRLFRARVMLRDNISACGAETF